MVGVVTGLLGGIVLGVVFYLGYGSLAGSINSSWVPRSHYFRTAMGWLGRALLIKRKHGGYVLKSTSFDAEVGMEETKLDGETHHWEDPKNLMTRFCGYPFGITHENSQTITNARYAEYGEKLADRARESSLMFEDGDDKYANAMVKVADSNDRLVNLDHSLALTSGDADPRTTDWSEQIALASQNPFKSGSLVDYVGGIVAFGAAFGLFWLASEVTDGGSSGVDVTIGMLDAMVMLG